MNINKQNDHHHNFFSFNESKMYVYKFKFLFSFVYQLYTRINIKYTAKDMLALVLEDKKDFTINQL